MSEYNIDELCDMRDCLMDKGDAWRRAGNPKDAILPPHARLYDITNRLVKLDLQIGWDNQLGPAEKRQMMWDYGKLTNECLNLTGTDLGATRTARRLLAADF